MVVSRLSEGKAPGFSQLRFAFDGVRREYSAYKSLPSCRRFKEGLTLPYADRFLDECSDYSVSGRVDCAKNVVGKWGEIGRSQYKRDPDGSFVVGRQIVRREVSCR